jgi:RNase P/RNase MRP subunit p29
VFLIWYDGDSFGNSRSTKGNGATRLISDERLNELRVEGKKIRVIRDTNEENDVKGIVVAWDEQSVLIRKQNRKVVKVPRGYVFQPVEWERPAMN